jgi:cysteinyl-tRNA synthetase
MSTKLLGAHFDIHGGGQDLQFPHHENEIAQSEGVLDRNDTQPFVKYWMHNGFVQLRDEKMSKSTGNFATIRELFKRHDPEVVRFFVVRAHYRSSLNPTSSNILGDAQHCCEAHTALKGAPSGATAPDWDRKPRPSLSRRPWTTTNTPEAVAVLFDSPTNQPRSSTALARHWARWGGLLRSAGAGTAKLSCVPGTGRRD